LIYILQNSKIIIRFFKNWAPGPFTCYFHSYFVIYVTVDAAVNL